MQVVFYRYAHCLYLRDGSRQTSCDTEVRVNICEQRLLVSGRSWNLRLLFPYLHLSCPDCHTCFICLYLKERTGIRRHKPVPQNLDQILFSYCVDEIDNDE